MMHDGDRLKAAVRGFNTTFTANNSLLLYLLFWMTLTWEIWKHFAWIISEHHLYKTRLYKM